MAAVLSINMDQETIAQTLKLGKEFPSMKEGKSYVLEYTVTRGESFRVGKARQHCWVAVCQAGKETGCQYQTCVNNSKGKCKITIIRQHTCLDSTHYGWKPAHSMACVAPAHHNAVNSYRKVRLRQIQSNERLQPGNQISYKQAWRVKHKIEENIDGTEEEQYHRLLSFLCYVWL